MTRFLKEDFLLQSKTAIDLYHNYAKGMPIIDYHNHLDPNAISSDKKYNDISELWLAEDHYKWRAMRACGIDEHYISGDASAEEKFNKWAGAVPHTMRNPLYHWTHMELKNFFGVEELLNEENAPEIFTYCNEKLKLKEFSSRALLKRQNVTLLCTTDHPTDSLESHLNYKREEADPIMLPTFRPDKFVHIESADFMHYLDLCGENIRTYDNLLAYLESRIDYFHKAGCRLADYGGSNLIKGSAKGSNLDEVIRKRVGNIDLKKEEIDDFKWRLMVDLSKIYHKKGWTMQLHLGAIRNTNSRLMRAVGADAGCDSIGDFPQAQGLAAFLDELDRGEKLPRTIIYNLNPGDNEVFATMAGNFRQVRWGAAWWFLDQKDGMEKHMDALSNMGLVSRFLGMLTDSRCLLSFSRHEYFRRMMCNKLGEDVENGLLPNDLAHLGTMVEDICYYNVRNFLKFTEVT